MERRELIITAKNYTFSAVGSLIEASRQLAARREQAASEKAAREAAHKALYAHIGNVFEMNAHLVRHEGQKTVLPFPNGDDGWVVIESRKVDKSPTSYWIHWLDQSYNPRPEADGYTRVIRSCQDQAALITRHNHTDEYLNWQNNPALNDKPLETEAALHLTEALEP